MRCACRVTLAVLVLWVVMPAPAVKAQGGRGSIQGRATDSAGGVLQGATVTVEPGGQRTVTGLEGDYVIRGLARGNYTVKVDFVGFTTFQQRVDIDEGGMVRLDATLQVAAQSESILVSAERPRGEAEQINRERTADNIVQVLSAEVITSLPNANIADALGRLPSVTLERDEGEGKYVQIRGTEPRLSNLTIDGVNVPSPETGVRQIKLDTLASDLVESIEINKTLQANMDGDGIGGSVNLRTKTASARPTIMMSGLGGYTPIIGGRGVSQFNATLGSASARTSRFGVLLGGTYDWNGRGINDIEPSPTVTSLSPHYDSIDLRDYMYYRTRWGMSGSADYRVNNGSSLGLSRALLDVPQLGPEVGLRAERRRRAAAPASTGAVPTTPSASFVGSGRHTIESRLAELGSVGRTFAHAAVRRQRRSELQVEQLRSELRQRSRPRPPTRSGRCSARHASRRCRQHRRHRQLQAVEMERRPRSANRRS